MPRNLLDLPLDILEHIFRDAFFTGTNLEINHLDTGIRKRSLWRVKPYNCAEKGGCLFAARPAHVLSVCHAFRRIATPILYKNIYIDLNYAYDHERSPRFLSSINKHPASLIRCLRLRLDIVDAVLPRCVFTDMVQRIARQFAGLEKLVLVYPVQEDELGYYRRVGIDAERETTRKIELLGSLLVVLGHLRVEVEKMLGALPFNPGAARIRYVPTNSINSAHGTAVQRSNHEKVSQFYGWHKLPEKVKRMIVRKIVLPPDDIIHPLLNVSSFSQTRSIMPLLLTCKEISRLTQAVIYEDAIFMSCLRKDRSEMFEFFRKRTSAQQRTIRGYYVNGLDHWNDPGLRNLLKNRFPKARDMEGMFGAWAWKHPCWDTRK